MDPALDGGGCPGEPPRRGARADAGMRPRAIFRGPGSLRRVDDQTWCGRFTMTDRWLLIENGTVIDGDANPPVPDCSVLVRNARIVKLGTVDRETDIPRGADVEVI